MIRIYANLIIAGRRTIDDVPSPIRAAVEDLLNDLGYEGRSEMPTYSFAGMTVTEVVRSLSYRPTKGELQQACDWLGIPYGGAETNAELRALIDEAAEAGAE